MLCPFRTLILFGLFVRGLEWWQQGRDAVSRSGSWVFWWGEPLGCGDICMGLEVGNLRASRPGFRPVETGAGACGLFCNSRWRAKGRARGPRSGAEAWAERWVGTLCLAPGYFAHHCALPHLALSPHRLGEGLASSPSRLVSAPLTSLAWERPLTEEKERGR